MPPRPVLSGRCGGLRCSHLAAIKPPDPRIKSGLSRRVDRRNPDSGPTHLLGRGG
jgi:hypothetical protein